MDTNKSDNPGNGQGGHSTTTIIVNTREKEVQGKEVSFAHG